MSSDLTINNFIFQKKKKERKQPLKRQNLWNIYKNKFKDLWDKPLSDSTHKS